MCQNVVNTIVANQLCIGCGTCAGICPQNALSMNFNKFGEYNPYLEKNCLKECELCLRVCPFHNGNENENLLGKSLYGNITDIKYQSETGYYIKSFVGYSPEFRQNGASGGITTCLLAMLLKENIVDYVIVVNAHNNSEQLFKYTIFEDENSILQSSGSVYYPVEISQAIKEILCKPGRYAIVGLPCILKGLRLATQKNQKLKERIVVMVGLVCGQTKSKHYTTYLSALAKVDGKLQSVHYRGKSSDRPASNFYFSCINEKGSKGRIFWNEGVSEAWVNRWFTPNACNFCDDVFAELADISLMDAWLPEYSDDSRGTNLIIVRSLQILNIINKHIEQNRMKLDFIPIDKVIQSQISVIDIKRTQLSYRMFSASKKGQHVPKKRVSENNKISLLKKHEIILKDGMQKESKNLFLKCYYGSVFNFDEFTKSMNIYTKKNVMHKLLKSYSYPLKIIKRIRQWGQ